jgi:hypothetical protein
MVPPAGSAPPLDAPHPLVSRAEHEWPSASMKSIRSTSKVPEDAFVIAQATIERSAP